jgi:hypothetical protein
MIDRDYFAIFRSQKGEWSGATVAGIWAPLSNLNGHFLTLALSIPVSTKKWNAEQEFCRN